MRRDRAPLVVVGDALLDLDLDGRAERLAPDAPVPVVDDPTERSRPGGAALAATLAAVLDRREVVLVTALARDEPGAILRELLEAAGVSVVDLGLAGPTAEKIRVRAGGPPAITRSVPGSWVRAAMTSPIPLRSTSRLTTSRRERSGSRGSTGPSGRNRLRSTPHGTTVTRCRSAPIRTSSKTSSEQVATMRSACPARNRSSRRRLGGLVSLAPWWRRLTTPRAWKVCTTGTPSGRAAARAARPDIQKWAWTTSGGSTRQERRSPAASSSMWGSSSSLGIRSGGPASTCSTVTPGAKVTRGGRSGSSRRV